MIALLAAFIIGVVLVICAWFGLAVLCGFIVGVSQLARQGIRQLRGLPPRRPSQKVAVPHANRVPVPFEVRAAVWARDGGVCVYCGSSEDLTVDHVFPRALGGSNESENLVTACRSCNSRKGTKTDMTPSPHALARRQVIELWRADHVAARNGNGNGHH